MTIITEWLELEHIELQAKADELMADPEGLDIDHADTLVKMLQKLSEANLQEH